MDAQGASRKGMESIVHRFSHEVYGRTVVEMQTHNMFLC